MPLPLRSLVRLVAIVVAAGCATTNAGAQGSSLIRGETATQRLELQAGPNLVSLRVIPPGASLESIFGDFVGQVFLAKDFEGSVFAPSHGVRTLTDWVWDGALFVSATEPFVVEVTGERIDSESEMALPAGWSWIPALVEEPTAVEDALRSILPVLTQVDDGAGRAYPAGGAAPVLETLKPGRGYRVHLSGPATLVYAQRPRVAPSPTVATIADALALQALEVGGEVIVTDPIRGGRFLVTESACVPNGGTCYVPDFVTEETAADVSSGRAVSLYDGEGEGAIAFESFRLTYGPGPDDAFASVQLHDHGDGATRLDPWKRSVSAGRSLRLNTPGPHLVTYRYTSSPLRLERTVEALTLEGQQTTDYVRPEWWGAQPYPSDWSPDRRTPAPNEDPTTAPDVAALDATDEVATALNSASALASATGREHYVVLGGMYGYSGVIQTKEGAPLKGERDGVRDRQGLRVIKGAPWRLWATRSAVSAEYAQPRRPEDYLASGGEPWVLIQHGRNTMLGRVIDLEVDGNLTENDYVFSEGYRSASGRSGNYIWKNALDELLQNTEQWNGFAVSRTSPRKAPQNANARLENVHVHDVGGNAILGNDWVHFGGSQNIRVGNAARNHLMYGVSTAPGTWVDGVEVYGFYWKGGIDPSQGVYHNLSFDIAGPSPYTDDPLEEFSGLRNDNPDPSRFRTVGGGSRHYWGEDVVFEGIEIFARAGAVPRLGYLGYTSGPVTFRDIVVRPHPANPATSGDRSLQLVYTGHANQSDRSHFRVERVRITPGVDLSNLVTMRSVTNVVEDVFVEDGGSAGQIAIRPGATPGKLVALIRNVSRFEDLHVFPTGGNQYLEFGFDVLVEGSPGSPTIVDGSKVHSVPLTTNSLNSGDPAAQQRCRVAWRDVTFGEFRDKPTVALQSFERVTYRGRTSEDSGTLDGAALTSGTVDVPTSLFLAPQSAEYVTVSGPDAARFEGWSLAPSSTTYAPVLRLSFSENGPVTVDWSAAIRPIPGDLTGTE